MSQVAEQAGEVAGEVVEEAIDGVVDVVEVMRNNPKMLALAGVVGVALGATGGYFAARATLKSYYEDLASQEIREAKEFYANLYKVGDDGEAMTPMEVLAERQGPEAVADVVRRYQGVTEEEAVTDQEGDDEMDEELLSRTESKVRTQYRKPSRHDDEVVVTTEKEETYEESMPASVRNTFDKSRFDLEAEKAVRTTTEPYIVTHDEYFTNEDDLDLVSLTYFENDRTLVYEMDELKPVDDVDGLVGEHHLARFGSGSGNDDKVFIRNDKVGNMYEITRSTGNYAEEVLGLMDGDEPDSLRHSAARDRRRAFRRGDE